MLEEHRFHRAHRRDGHPLARVLEVGVMPRAVKHGHDPGGQRAIARVQVLWKHKQHVFSDTMQHDESSVRTSESNRSMPMKSK